MCLLLTDTNAVDRLLVDAPGCWPVSSTETEAGISLRGRQVASRAASKSRLRKVTESGQLDMAFPPSRNVSTLFPIYGNCMVFFILCQAPSGTGLLIVECLYPDDEECHCE